MPITLRTSTWLHANSIKRGLFLACFCGWVSPKGGIGFPDESTDVFTPNETWDRNWMESSDINSYENFSLMLWKLEDWKSSDQNYVAIQALILWILNLKRNKRIKTLSSLGQGSKPLKNKFYHGVGHIYTSDVAWEVFPRAARYPSIDSVFYRGLLPIHILSVRDKTRGWRRLTLISASLSGQWANLKEGPLAAVE